jgi:hypothetical protein
MGHPEGEGCYAGRGFDAMFAEGAEFRDVGGGAAIGVGWIC